MTEGDTWRPVPAELDLPASVYESRAGVTGVAVEQPGVQAWEFAAANGSLEFFADVSQFQNVPIDARYPYRQFSFRVCDGTYLDPIAAQNWTNARALMNDPTHPLTVVYPYVVFRPGTLNIVAGYLSKILGAKLPDRVAVMIDAEPWGGEIKGDHSAELNQWAAYLATVTVSGYQSVIGYSYTSGFQELWPSFDSRVKRRTASYGTWDPGFYDWQYSGGTGTGGQPGWPHGAGPWQLCDMNVTQRPIETILNDYGFTGSTVTAPTAHDNAEAVWTRKIIDAVTGGTYSAASLLNVTHEAAEKAREALSNVVLDQTTGHPYSLPNLEAKLDELAADIATLQETVDKLVSQPPATGLSYGSQVILSMPSLPSEPV